MYKNSKSCLEMGCPYFIAYTYLHLLLGVLVSSAAAVYDPLGKLGINSESIVPSILILISSFVLLYICLMLKPGILKYILFIIFITLIGSSLRNILDRLKAKQILVNVLLTISSIFLTMTVIGFVDKQNTLGFGPYLFASLIGLILGHLGIGAALLFKVPGEQLSGISYAISFISTLVFSIYVAYDTQMLKEDAAACKSHPDYINSALSLYLDILNLFVSVGDLADS